MTITMHDDFHQAKNSDQAIRLWKKYNHSMLVPYDFYILFLFFFSRQYVFQLPFIFVLWITIIYLFVLFFMFVAATAQQKRNLFAFFPPPLNSFVCERCFQQKICWNRSFWVIWLNTVKKIPSLNEYLTDFCHFFIMSKEKNLVQFLSPANS